MASSRPSNEEARRMGVVPYSGSNSGKLNGNSNGSTSLTPSYETVNLANANGTNNRAVPENFSSSKGGNDHLWDSGGSQNYQQNWQQPTAAAPQYNRNGGPPPTWQQPTAPQDNSNGGPPPNWQQQPTKPQSQTRSVPPQGSSYVQGVPVSYGQNGGYVQGPQPVDRSQRPNFQAPQGGYIDQGPPKGAIPKGDYVYYDGNDNQIRQGGPPYVQGPQQNDQGSGSDRHHHHHYYHYQQPQQPAGSPYDKKLEQKKKRRPGAHALAAALIACWACTCCCHAPCGC